MRGGKGVGVQFRVAAGEPAAVGALRRRLVGERRERHDFGAGLAPGLEQVRIDEAEGAVAGERDALARRRQRRGGARCCGELERPGGADQRAEVDMALGGGGKTIDQRVKIGMLVRLHEAEMPLGQRQRRIAGQGTEHGNA